jgi:hypothetical protein
MDGIRFALPPLRPGVRNLLIALGALYVVELVLANFLLPDRGLLYQWLAWLPSPLEPLWSQLWQPLTKYLVQGPAVFNVLIGLLVLYFFLPWVLDRFVPRQIGQLALSVVLGCFVAGLAWSGIAWTALSLGVPASGGWIATPAMGWHPFVVGMVAAFALGNPKATINFFFVLPMKAQVLLYVELGLLGLMFLASPGVHTFEMFGALAGVWLWFQFLGPGATRRKYARKGRQIEKELKFQVFEGGRAQDGKNDPDVWH